MKRRKLGKEGLEVSALGLGCMGMSFAYGAPSEESESLKVLDRALELGIDFWDTAEIYGPWKNEELLGRALKGRRDKVVLATKFAWQLGPDGSRIKLNSSPAHLKKAVEGSLKRLGTDHIDLLYQHRLDPATPIEDTVGAVAELIQEGKVRFIGLCEVGSGTLKKAHATHPISALQSEYSIWETALEEKVIPTLNELGIGLVPYSPVGRGFLTGQIKKFEDIPEGDFRRMVPRFQGENFKENLKLVDEVKKIGIEHGFTPSQVALAWLLQKGPGIVPIPGTTQIKHLEENAKSADIDSTVISKEEWARIDHIFEKFAVRGLRYPEEMMKYIDRD